MLLSPSSYLNLLKKLKVSVLEFASLPFAEVVEIIKKSRGKVPKNKDEGYLLKLTDVTAKTPDKTPEYLNFH